MLPHFTPAGVQVTPQGTADEIAAIAAEAAAEQAAYQELKQEVQAATAVLGALCFAAAYIFYGKVSATRVICVFLHWLEG